MACTFLIEPIAKLFNAIQEQIRENQRNFFLAGNLQIYGDSNSNGEPWGSHSLFRQGHIKGEVDFQELTKVVHGDLIEFFLNLPDNLQSEIADQAINFSIYGKDIFDQAATEQMTVKEIRMLLTMIKQQASSVF